MEKHIIPQIIHGNHSPRIPILLNELQQQGINEFNIVEGICDKSSVVKSINLSHKKIVQQALDNGDEMTCIFEDDIKFTDLGAWHFYISRIPKDFDLYLGGIYLGDIAEDSTTKAFTALHCYIIHSRFYATFLSTPDNVHIDRSLDNLGKYVVCHPFIAIQQNGYSSNTGKEETYDNLYLNRTFFKKFN